VDANGRAVVAGCAFSDTGWGLIRLIGGNAPSAASASVGGRVTTMSGRGISNARISLTDSLGVRRTAITSAFGYYNFYNVATGQVYTITVVSKRYSFQSRQMVVNQSLSEVDFVSLQ
jgi:hypothetical protein